MGFYLKSWGKNRRQALAKTFSTSRRCESATAVRPPDGIVFHQSKKEDEKKKRNPG